MNTEQNRTRVDLFATMTLIRALEERCEVLFREAKVKGAMHLCIGQEAVPTGVCSVMRPGDTLSFTYRGHGWALARGIQLEAVLAELFGRVDGCSGGRGGSKHLGDWDRRILPSNAIVAGGLPLAAGVALASKLQKTGSVTVVAFGEGATNQGVFHETMTMASLWRLPLVFVCEDNHYMELTPAKAMLPVGSVRDRALGYDIPAVDVDGMDVEDVAHTASESMARARDGGGPTFLVANTYRFCGHMTGDAWVYRSPVEVEEWRKRDPVELQRTRLLDEGIDDEVIDEIDRDVVQQVADAELRAAQSPEPDPKDILTTAPSWATR